MAGGSARRCAAIAALACIFLLPACTGGDDSAPTTSSTPSMSVPPPAPETTAPSADANYMSAISTFCAAAGQVRSALLAIAVDQGAGHPVDEVAGVADQFHDDFAALYAAHQQQFGNDVNGIEPIDSAFAVDAAIEMLAAQAKDSGQIALTTDDPIFQQFSEVSNGCAAQGATMP